MISARIDGNNDDGEEDDGTRQCNACSEDISPSAERWWCEPCDYDMCASCYHGIPANARGRMHAHPLKPAQLTAASHSGSPTRSQPPPRAPPPGWRAMDGSVVSPSGVVFPQVPGPVLAALDGLAVGIEVDMSAEGASEACESREVWEVDCGVCVCGMGICRHTP